MLYLFIHVLDPVFVRHDVCLNQLMLLHQVLHRGQVLAVIVRVQQRLDLAQPKVQILDGGDEGPLPVGLLQFHRLLRRLVRQDLPLLGDRLESVNDGLFGSGTLLAVNLKNAMSCYS
jgi:hypothetical protein